MKNRTASVCDSAWYTKRAQALLRGCPGASRDQPGKAFGSFLGALGPPRATQDRSRGGLLAPQSRPQHVPVPSPERSQAPQSARERPRAKFGRFFVVLGLARARFCKLRCAFSRSEGLGRTHFRCLCALCLAFSATFYATSSDLQAPPSHSVIF